MRNQESMSIKKTVMRQGKTSHAAFTGFTAIILILAILVASFAAIETIKLDAPTTTTDARSNQKDTATSSSSITSPTTTITTTTSIAASSLSYSSSYSSSSTATTITSFTTTSYFSTTSSTSSSSVCNTSNDSYSGQTWFYGVYPTYAQLGTVVPSRGQNVTLSVLLENDTNNNPNSGVAPPPVVGQTVCFYVFNEVKIGVTNSTGSASATFVVPDNAPAGITPFNHTVPTGATLQYISAIGGAFCVQTCSSSSSNSSNPTINYIPTNNSPDYFGTPSDNLGSSSIYSALDTNTGQLGWVFETAQNDSIYTVSNNKLSEITSNFRQTPTGITFDSQNNIAYITYYIPGGGPPGISAIVENHVVDANLSLKSSPVEAAYDQYYNYLYVSVGPRAMTNQTQLGIAVVNPDSGKQLAYIPISDGPPTLFAYDSNTGDMFAATLFYNGSMYLGASIYDVRGASVVSSFTVHNASLTSMIYNPSNEFLYLAEQNGDILVWNPSSGNQVGTIYSYSSSPNPSVAMVYDSANQYVYAFEGSEMLLISGTSVQSNTTIPHNVTSALYNPVYDSILAFY